MTDVLVPGARDVRGTLDVPTSEGDATDGPADGTDESADPDADRETLAVACPPHPQHRGHRSDERLVAVADHLTDAGVACLRIDYGDWDEGYGEREDVRNAVRWAADRADRVGLFGYSFGASLAILAAASVEVPVTAVSTLAPAARLGVDLDAAAAVHSVDCPLQVCYGARDETVEWAPVVEAARETGADVVELPADHFFVGQADRVGDAAGSFLAEAMLAD